MLNSNRPFVIATTMIVVVTLTCVAVSVVAFLLAIAPVTPVPDSVVNPPLFPGAEQVKVTEQQYVQDPKAFYYKEIEYVVAAQPEEVQAFHKEALSKDGWVRPLASDQLSTGVAFEWYPAGIGPTDTAFRIDISAVAITDKSTKVTLYILRFDPR